MNYYLALRLQALNAVLDPDEDANLRHIFRWYSRTFHTPLQAVEEIPVDDVLQAFYEQSYEDLSEEERQTELKTLLETPEDKRLRLRAQDEEQAEAFEFARYTAEEERRKEEKKKLSDIQPEGNKAFQVRKIPEATLPKSQPMDLKGLKELPPDIEMKFLSESEFEAEANGPGTMLPSQKPQSFK